MILDGWFWVGLVIGALSLVVCVIAAIRHRFPADSSIISVAAVEAFLVVYAAVAALRQVGGEQLNGPAWEFWGYVITALIVPVIAVAWAVTDKTRWSNVVLAVVGPTVVVMVHRMQYIWFGQW
ncbi:MAG: hypothetical protein Q4G34_02185 [Micrococcus sp.]|nr:hypothetical protein [Micrococcus sp.]